MMTFLVVYGGIALFASVILLLDYFGRRQRKARQTAAGSNSSPHSDDFWP